MIQDEIENPYKSENDDEISKLHPDDTRKPKLLLKTLNKLRKMKELRQFEKVKQQEFIELLYGIPSEQPSTF
jgi:hypothetical protein